MGPSVLQCSVFVSDGSYGNGRWSIHHKPKFPHTAAYEVHNTLHYREMCDGVNMAAN